MADVKWIKIVTDIFDDEKVLLIESLPGADSIIVIWFKLLCLAGKNNNSGVFMMNERIAYTDEMLSTIFRRDINTIRLALKTFKEFGMVELINDVITIPNWSKHQNLDQMEERKEYMKNYMQKRRSKQKELSEGKSKVNSKVNSKSNSKVNVNSLEEEGEEEREVDKDIEVDIEVDIDNIKNSWNSLGLIELSILDEVRLSKLKELISEYKLENILKAIKNIGKSSFLKGINEKGWTATFDWFIETKNFIKVLEGNYTDRKGAKAKNNLKFDNFEGRDYDYDALEKKLLGWDKDDE